MVTEKRVLPPSTATETAAAMTGASALASPPTAHAPPSPATRKVARGRGG